MTARSKVLIGGFPRRDICLERARLCGLTPREIEVARELVSGKTNDEIARTMGVSAHTVRTHIERILAKTFAKTRTGAVAVLASFECPPLDRKMKSPKIRYLTDSGQPGNR